MLDLFNSPRFVQDRKGRSLSFYAVEDWISISNELVAALEDASIRNGKTNARICLHKSPDDPFHEMIILEYANKYFRPHKHLFKGESVHIIKGELLMITFKENGKIDNFSRCSTSGNLIARVGVDQWHCVIPTSDFVVYHESKPGPYLGSEDSIFPSWAPDGRDEREAMAYLQNLVRSTVT